MIKNNFDILRILLATIVFYMHMGALVGIDTLSKLPGTFAVQCFFVVSGYLIVKSYLRNMDVKNYIKSRFFRIYPLYFIVITLSFIIGYINYSQSFGNYIDDGALKYLISNYFLANFLAPSLPELFTNNPYSIAVNGVLWTIKVEVMFYISVPIIYGFFSKYLSNKSLTITLAIISVCCHYAIGYLIEYHGFNHSLNNQLPSMMIFFMVGALFNFVDLSFFKVKHLTLVIPLLFLFEHFYLLNGILIGIFVYIVVNVIKPIKVSEKVGDISYGIYIWHFPVIQISIMYGLFENIYIGFVASSVVVMFMALCSWHFIESKLIHKPK
ncbi:acyltransferase [Shewanella gelidimarina]|uniref:acyltransferase family protein n=1 Tax=Shewanella gelidimarina TaxID=56813 RepID=UPI00200BB62F|nr:acyltransferase [Shewanella gelidimarina]MCL1057883.1 acyltransferase [Shewanella gelidimarina]